MTRSEAINTLKPIAYRLQSKHDWLRGKLSLLMSQVLCESGNLKHAHGNNCLGIKWTSHYPESKKQMLWTKEWVDGKYISVKAPFVKFDSIEECIEQGYIRILKLKRYKETRNSVDWWDATNYIRLNGYATSPTYTSTLRKIILSNKLYEMDWRHDPDDELTSDFTYGETFNLAVRVQKVRDKINKPLVVTRYGGWYRQPSYNALVGGVSDSKHLTCEAVDLCSPRGYSGHGLYLVFRNNTDIKRYGIASNWLHVDIAEAYDIWYY